jgi:pyruvate/2-oxoglutarate dehydrogenase complex dihydrolipoamide dehydrogenase (E3) component
VFSAEEIYENPERAGKRVSVLGGGLVGVELAIYLAQSGRAVTIIEMLPVLNNGGNILHQLALDVEIQKNNLALKLGTRALKIDASGVRCDAGLVDADTVIYAVGQAPNPADALREYAPEFYQIGDCVTPKNITQTTAMADAAAREIG